MTKSLCLAVALLLTASTRLLATEGGDPAEVLWSAIEAEEWAAGLEVCESLASSEGERPDRGDLPASHFACLASLCAAISSGAGDNWRTNWWWFTAVALDLQEAGENLRALRELGLLKDLLPPRGRVDDSRSKRVTKTRVLLPDGRLLEGTPPERLGSKQHPEYLFVPIDGIARQSVKVELIVGKDGLPWQPVLVSAKALPVHVFLTLFYLHELRFNPAMVADEPVDSVYAMTISQTVQ